MSSASPSPMRGLGFALTGFAFFAMHDALIKHLGTTYSVFQIIFFAMLFAFIPMATIMLADKAEENFRPRHPWLVVARGALGIVGMSGAFYAFSTLPLTEVYGLLFSTPLLITAFSVPLLGEVVRIRRWLAVFVGLIGVLIVLRPGVSEFTLGHAAALTAACASALTSVVLRKIGGQERSAVLILYTMLAALLVTGVLMPQTYKPIELPDLLLLAGVGFLSVCAQFCIIYAYRQAPAAVIAPIQYSQILWAAVFGVLFFMEKPDVYVAIGSAIVIGSGVFVVWRESKQDVSAQSPVLRTGNPRYDAGPSPWTKKSE